MPFMAFIFKHNFQPLCQRQKKSLLLDVIEILA
jgi:hypothetical protein